MKRFGMTLALTLLFPLLLSAVSNAVWSSGPYSTGGAITVTVPTDKPITHPSAVFKTATESVAITAVSSEKNKVTITIVPLDNGSLSVPEIVVSGGEKEVVIPAKTISVAPVTSPKETTLRDIKKSAVATIKDYTLLWVFAALLLLVLLLFFVWKWWKKHRKERPKEVYTASPREVAAGYYARAESALRDGRIGDAVDAVTVGIRDYLERRSGAPFLEMTTREVVKRYADEQLPKEQLDGLTRMLRTGDRYKFAEEMLHASDVEEMLHSFSTILDAVERVYIAREEALKAKEEVRNALS